MSEVPDLISVAWMVSLLESPGPTFVLNTVGVVE